MALKGMLASECPKGSFGESIWAVIKATQNPQTIDGINHELVSKQHEAATMLHQGIDLSDPVSAIALSEEDFVYKVLSVVTGASSE